MCYGKEGIKIIWIQFCKPEERTIKYRSQKQIQSFHKCERIHDPCTFSTMSYK